MKFTVQFSGEFSKTRVVELQREKDRWRIRLDGEPVDADATEVAPGVYSVLINGQSHEIQITPSGDGRLSLQVGHHEFAAEIVDPRSWQGRRHGAVEGPGRQQIVAPMPGRIVRILVRPGEKVEAGQGVLVVEAMKMQNEVHSSKSGTVDKVLVREGQPVNAGEVLAWIE